MKRRQIAQLLPEIYQRTLPEQWWQEPPAGCSGEVSSQPRTVLGIFLTVMEQMQAHDETVLEKLDTYFDPLKASEAWLPYLASWLDLDRFLKWDGRKKAWVYPGGMPRLRLLIMEAVSLNQQRGTISGLERFLTTATGVGRIKVSSSAPFHITVTYPSSKVPATSLRGDQFHAWLEELVEAEKPAYVTYEVRRRATKARPVRKSARWWVMGGRDKQRSIRRRAHDTTTL